MHHVEVPFADRDIDGLADRLRRQMADISERRSDGRRRAGRDTESGRAG